MAKVLFVFMGVIIVMMIMAAAVVGFIFLVPFAIFGGIYQLTVFLERRKMLKEAANVDLDEEWARLQGELRR